jgi:hypothetical protein
MADPYQLGTKLSSFGRESKPLTSMNFGTGSYYVPTTEEGTATKDYNWLPGVAESASSKGNDIMSILKLKDELTGWKPEKSWWQNTIEGRGNVLGLASTAAGVLGAGINIFDVFGDRKKSHEVMDTQIAAGKQAVRINDEQNAIQKANANARNEAAQRFTPSTPTTTMLS